jgi:nucleoside-diphosphate-sugar epimerase
LLNKDTELIQIGSSSEYGKKNNPTKECDNFNVSNIYESTKGAATLLCQGYARNYNLPIIIVRPYSVFGRYEKKYRFIPSIIKNILLNENITIYNGNHDFIYIKDFIRGINILLNSNKKIIGDIVNFCSGIQYSNKEVYETACKIFNKKNTNAIFKNEFLRKQDNLCWIGDSSYAKFQYNFKTEYSLEQGIKDIKKEIYGQGTEKIRETLDRYFL